MKVLGMLVAGLLITGCSLGDGTGQVKSDRLFAHECWGQIDGGGNPAEEIYDMQPDFFAANAYRSTLQIRVQRGNDLVEVSDGLSVLIDDVPKIRAALAVARSLKSSDAGVEDAGVEDAGAPDGGGQPACASADPASGSLGPHADGTATFQVALPAGVTPPGSPAIPPPDLLEDPPIVHMALFLHRSCHNQNTVLYAVSGTITFSSLFSGDPNESSAAEKLIDVTKVDIQVGDLRDVPLGAYPREIPCDLQSRIQGKFKFYFDRGQPAQPFP
jgi:hypothetical protein